MYACIIVFHVDCAPNSMQCCKGMNSAQTRVNVDVMKEPANKQNDHVIGSKVNESFGAGMSIPNIRNTGS